MKVDRKVLTYVLVIFIALLIAANVIPIPSLSFISSNYEGPKPSFAAVYYDGKWYTNENYYTASLHRFDTYLEFDPDDPLLGKGNLEGEMTSIFIPTSSNIYNVPNWVPREWISSWEYIKNPINVYEWSVKDEDGRVHYYRMEEWVLKWYVTIEYGYDSYAEAYVTGLGYQAVRYNNAEVWFKINLNPMWYFDNVTNVYFGIGKVRLDRIKIDSMDPESVDITPESAGSILPIYTSLPTDSGTQVNPEQEIFRYKGSVLNPSVFRREVYTYITLNDFGANVYGLAIPPKVQSDVVTFEFTVKTFVVGEWVVKDLDQVPDNYGRQSKIVGGWLTDLVGGVLSNPLTWVIMFIALLVVLAVFFPSSILVLAELVRAVRKK